MKNGFIALIITAFLFILTACGGGGGGSSDAPAEAEITTSVTSISVEFLDTAPYVCGFVDSFVIVVKDKKTGIPLNGVDVNIFNASAQPNGANQLYDGNPNDGGAAEDSPMTVTTDKNGAYTLYFTYCGGGGFEYKSDFMLSSGSVTELVEFEVKKKTAT
ncbi:MAG: hypothetical protein HZB30_06845 [Nitrospirae bacterium]|nr:hypothetical protein [Nitrospirota bacterium]